LKLSGRLKYLGLVLPFLLTSADDNGVRGHQFLESLGVIGKPGTPDSLAHLENFSLLMQA
jgi:hypothetical protein